jgi:nucleotide-binding universal stress UspA family protein
MKSILVPTDFSACAHNAFDVAQKLARRFDARLHLLACIDIPEQWDTLTPNEQRKHHHALQQIRNTETLFATMIEGHEDINIVSTYRGGKVIPSIVDYISHRPVDFVVMGSHGVSGKSEYFIGSNTQKVIRKIHCPVLVIKDPLPDVNFDTVVFASNFHESEKEVFLKFKDFVKHFVPEIHLVEVHTSSLMDPPYIISKEAMESFKNLCAPFSCKTHVYRDYNIDQGIRSFADEIGAKLIGISNHHRRPLKRMIAGSNVEALVNHADIPVLSIDY